MQSEEIEDKESSPTPQSTGMIFKEIKDLSPIPKQITPENFKSPLTTGSNFDSLISHGDTEKMIPESPSSSDTEEEIGAKVNPEIIKSLHEQTSNESIRTWLQRITQMQNEIQKKLHVAQSSAVNETVVKNSSHNPNRVTKYQDLPYMGEMTLDNSKPRRGRKPKKADICHLIYKNYGTIFPGTPNVKSMLDKDNPKKTNLERLSEQSDSNRTDVQNRISSLLEKRLTQESKRQKEENKVQSQNEPLNLCIRDMDHLKIRLKKSEIKSEPQSDDDVEVVSDDFACSKDFKFPGLPSEGDVKVNENGGNPGYVYWPNGGVFIHPMALQQQLMYYQKMTANNNNNYSASSGRPTPTATPELQNTEYRKLQPKKVKKNESNEEESFSGENKSKRNSTGGDKTPAKRKRSAIFIPPIPPENQNNPATEVSICKFKFTGGAKPSLQEKKMLSVDSGGNFRYYSGTGDKSMRGYEFFPRETLQQQVNNAQGSSTGAFLQASGEKIYPSSPVDFTGKVNEFMLTPEISTPTPSISDPTSRNKKRKSRKSIQREKLEQTFKEKGFLIQTQQLESAEGATYCKFRQLRKFTRYLFRSWKDYLPGNVAENPDGNEKTDLDEITEQDLENISNLSSPVLDGGETTPPP